METYWSGNVNVALLVWRSPKEPLQVVRETIARELIKHEAIQIKHLAALVNSSQFKLITRAAPSEGLLDETTKRTLRLGDLTKRYIAYRATGS